MARLTRQELHDLVQKALGTQVCQDELAFWSAATPVRAHPFFETKLQLTYLVWLEFGPVTRTVIETEWHAQARRTAKKVLRAVVQEENLSLSRTARSHLLNALEFALWRLMKPDIERLRKELESFLEPLPSKGSMRGLNRWLLRKFMLSASCELSEEDWIEMYREVAVKKVMTS